MLLFVYTLARFGDSTISIHLVYLRHLLPECVRSATITYILNLFESCLQVFHRIASTSPVLAQKTVSDLYLMSSHTHFLLSPWAIVFSEPLACWSDES